MAFARSKYSEELHYTFPMRSLSKALLCAMLLAIVCQGQIRKPIPAELCTPCIHADMDFLASDELQGRGSGTRDEHLAALYAASLFASFGLEPGGGDGTFLQKAPLPATFPPDIARRLAGFAQVPRKTTWNVVGILQGTDAGKEAILLTAHLDHLGIGPAKNGDRIYNGADDDASGTTAVIELARAFAAAPRPARTLIFVLFGSEELGGYGNRYFLGHPPTPLDRIIANLEFEMIGRRDPALPRDGLWLTGYERSDLGSELARHGASLVADPHPEQKFFTRSDNYSLAKRGIVAHTVSSFGLHADYHQPGDELSRIDFPHMTRAIQSMVEPIEWLAQTSWKPKWLPKGKP
jgi:Zn-dependent M28 family amino/carboxypeptidase